MEQCKNCQHPLTGPYCSQCGQEKRGRFTVRGLLQDFIDSLTNLERGFWHTIRELSVQPARVVEDYIAGKTRPYMNPLRYAFFLTGISVLLNVSLGIFDQQQQDIQQLITPDNVDAELLAQQQIFQERLRPFLNIIPLFLIPFTAYFYKLFFRRSTSYNYAEHVVINTFAQGHLALLSMPVIFLGVYTELGYKSFLIGMLFYMLYNGWIYKKLSAQGWAKAFAKSLFAFLSGYISLILIVSILGLLVGLLVGFLQHN